MKSPAGRRTGGPTKHLVREPASLRRLKRSKIVQTGLDSVVNYKAMCVRVRPQRQEADSAVHRKEQYARGPFPADQEEQASGTPCLGSLLPRTATYTTHGA